jgi:hypothetical protein
MLTAKESQRGNPFFGWAFTFAPPGSHVYVPDKRVVATILKRWNLTLDDLTREYSSVIGKKDNLTETIEKVVRYWASPIAYEPGSKTVVLGGVKMEILDQYIPTDWGTRYYFIKGWHCTPELTTLLLRFIRKNGGNEKNPFNVFKNQIVFDSKAILPDILYLPELYKELGIQSLEELKIEQTGDWKSLWREVTNKYSDRVSRDAVFFFVYKEETEIIPYLWKENNGRQTETVYYVSKLPRIVIDRFKMVIAQRKGDLSSKRWTKDAFQSLAKNLKGEDLISLCLTDKKLSQLCQTDSQLVFRVKLMEEFGIDYMKDDHDFESPLLLYRRMYTFFEYVRSAPLLESEKPIYLVDTFDSKKKSNLKPFAERLVTLVPPKEAERTIFWKNGHTMIIFFPAMPELSYYVSMKVDGGSHYNPIFSVVKLMSAKNLLKFLSEEDILTFTRSVMDAYRANEDDPHYEDVDRSWYYGLSGDDEIVVLESGL